MLYAFYGHVLVQFDLVSGGNSNIFVHPDPFFGNDPKWLTK